jgi:hypothetical protein
LYLLFIAARIILNNNLMSLNESEMVAPSCNLLALKGEDGSEPEDGEISEEVNRDHIK